MIEHNWTEVNSDIWSLEADAQKLFSAFVGDLKVASEELKGDDFNDEIERLRRVYHRRSQGLSRERIAARTAFLDLMADLARQGWRFSYKSRLLIQPPREEGREVRKAQLIAQRTEQLRTSPIQEFVRRIEKGRWHRGRRVSIFSLMRDGRDLASALEKVMREGAPMDSAISPYLQFVNAGADCEYTGIPLADIWRYFRYTWTNPYQSVPGRTMMFLVRDAASPFHPIMGIGALSSAAVKLRGRDEFLGWEAEEVLAKLESNPSAKAMRWLESVLDDRLNEIYKADLVEDGILPPRVDLPSQELLARLRAEAVYRREQHHALMEAGEYKKESARGLELERLGDEYWKEQARTPLFRSKRSGELASLLYARQVFQNFSGRGPKDQLMALLRDKGGRDAIAGLVRLAKATRVGTAIADLTICGALPPYNPLLAGKLVALLAASPEVVCENRRRYGRTPSVIASSMAGRAIVRAADLVFIGTTSLYGERPCQYDRISIPTELLGLQRGHSIKYRFIADTVGWGTFQFSDLTTRSIMRYVKAEKNGQRVNFVFGEGANPKMRALREGLAALGFDEEKLLRHGHRRSMFGVALISNLSDYLLGQDPKPRYLFSLRSPEKSTREIVSWWTQRWLKKRLNRPEVFSSVREHTLIHPIEHGARVRLPSSDPEQVRLLP